MLLYPALTITSTGSLTSAFAIVGMQNTVKSIKLKKIAVFFIIPPKPKIGNTRYVLPKI
jgi:hypothetical protein